MDFSKTLNQVSFSYFKDVELNLGPFPYTLISSLCIILFTPTLLSYTIFEAQDTQIVSMGLQLLLVFF